MCRGCLRRATTGASSTPSAGPSTTSTAVCRRISRALTTLRNGTGFGFLPSAICRSAASSSGAGTCNTDPFLRWSPTSDGFMLRAVRGTRALLCGSDRSSWGVFLDRFHSWMLRKKCRHVYTTLLEHGMCLWLKPIGLFGSLNPATRPQLRIPRLFACGG
jgi:hypothetical protein